jgi:hypothetical protein
LAVSAVQKPDDDGADASQDRRVHLADDNADVDAQVRAGATLIAGTSWL